MPDILRAPPVSPFPGQPAAVTADGASLPVAPERPAMLSEYPGAAGPVRQKRYKNLHGERLCIMELILNSY